MLLRLLDKLLSKKEKSGEEEQQATETKKGSIAPPETFTHKCVNCGQCKNNSKL